MTLTVVLAAAEDVFGATRPVIGEPSGLTATGSAIFRPVVMSPSQPLQASDVALALQKSVACFSGYRRRYSGMAGSCVRD